MKTKRWLATVRYRHDAGVRSAVHELQELRELHHIVERGPAWWTVERIEIAFIGIVPGGAITRTVEEAGSM